MSSAKQARLRTWPSSAPAGSRGFPPAAASLGKTGRGNRCICMSCTHTVRTRPANAATGPPPGSRSRYQKYCVVAASGSEERRPCVRCGASRACWKTELGMAGSGCLWQTPFCSLRRSSLPFSPILSALSPPSRQMVIATSHVAALHCDATRPPPSLPFRP